jgi:hypothetical protein
MKTIIAGSRTITSLSLVLDAIMESGWDICEVVSGCARGVDTLGEAYAKNQGIPVKKFPADWKRYSKLAGPQRNNEMVCYADACIAVWDGESGGTRDMIEKAIDAGLITLVVTV